jgi:hypothetical protein
VAAEIKDQLLEEKDQLLEEKKPTGTNNPSCAVVGELEPAGKLHEIPLISRCFCLERIFCCGAL